MEGVKMVVMAAVAVIIIGSILVPICNDAASSGDNDDLYVVALAGQSNAAYRFADVPEVNAEVSAPEEGCYYYGTASAPVVYESYTDVSDYGIYSMYSDEWKIGNIEPTLAKYIGDITGHDVLVINCGVSGASISQLVPSGQYNAWTTTILEDALSKITVPYQQIGFVWVQGEADTNMEQSTYIAYFDEILDYYDGLGFHTSYIIQTKGINSRYAQQTIVATHSNVYMATDVTAGFSIYNGMIRDDTVHYTQAADILVGQLTGEFIGDKIAVISQDLKLVLVIPVVVIAALVVAVAATFIRSKY